jgi:hypothetical protein
MITAVLPAEYTVRPPVPADSRAIFALVSAYNTAVIGSADCTLADITNGIVDPGLEPRTDGWLVLDRDGVPVSTGCGSTTPDQSLPPTYRPVTSFTAAPTTT